MKPGRIPAPRVRLHPQLRAAVRSAMAQGHQVKVLALLNGFPDASTFSVQLHSEGFAASVVNASRWRLVAGMECIRYAGEIFVVADGSKDPGELPEAPTGTAA